MFNIKDIVKNSDKVVFQRYRNGIMYYSVNFTTFHSELGQGYEETHSYEFQVPLSDIADATLFREDKTIMFMRYIRKALEEGTFIDME